jgi:probable HAF family extracellular repeat protein
VKATVSKFLLSVCTFSFCLTSSLWAASYKYAKLNVPGSTSTSPTGINNKGEVVGYYQNKKGVYGFLWSHGKYTTINCPAASTGTFVYGINDNGVIVGYYGIPFHNYGFEYINGHCKKLATFKGSTPYPTGINNAGDIVGSYFVSTNVEHGFVLRNKKYRDISVPNSSQTIAFGINKAGDISGTYTDAAGNHGFLRHNGSYRTINVPGSSSKTDGAGLNDKDVVVGSYENPQKQLYQGFLDNTGKIQTLMFPGSVTTFPSAINDSDVVVGNYFHGTVNPAGFMATPQ